MCLKAPKRGTGLILRWVHSEQLANSFTKPGGKELESLPYVQPMEAMLT